MASPMNNSDTNDLNSAKAQMNDANPRVLHAFAANRSNDNDFIPSAKPGSTRVLNALSEYTVNKTEKQLRTVITTCDDFYGFETIQLSIVKGKPESEPVSRLAKPQHFKTRRDQKNPNQFLTVYRPTHHQPIGLKNIFSIEHSTIAYLYDTVQALSSSYTRAASKLKLLNSFLQNCDYDEVAKAGHVFRALCQEIGNITNPKYQAALVHLVKRSLARLDEFLVEKKVEIQLTPLHSAFMKLCANGRYFSFAAQYLEKTFMLPSLAFGTNYATLFIYYYHSSILLFEEEEFAKAYEFAITALVSCPWMQSDAVFSRYLVTALIASNKGYNLDLGTTRAMLINPNHIVPPTTHMSSGQFRSMTNYFSASHKYARLYRLAAAPHNVLSKEVAELYSDLDLLITQSFASAKKKRASKEKTESVSDTVNDKSTESFKYTPSYFEPKGSAFFFLNEINSTLPLLSSYQLESEIYKLITKHRTLYFENLPEYYLTIGSDVVTEADKCRDYLESLFDTPSKPISEGSGEQLEKVAHSQSAKKKMINSEFASMSKKTDEESKEKQKAIEASNFDSKTQENLTKEFVFEMIMQNQLCATIEEEPSNEVQDESVMDVDQSNTKNKLAYWLTFQHDRLLNDKTELSQTLEEQLEQLKQNLGRVGEANQKLKQVSSQGLPDQKDTILGALGLGNVKPEYLLLTSNGAQDNVIYAKSNDLGEPPRMRHHALKGPRSAQMFDLQSNYLEAFSSESSFICNISGEGLSEHERGFQENSTEEKDIVKLQTVEHVIGCRIGRIMHKELQEYYQNAEKGDRSEEEPTKSSVGMTEFGSVGDYYEDVQEQEGLSLRSRKFPTYPRALAEKRKSELKEEIPESTDDDRMDISELDVEIATEEDEED